MGVLGWVLRSSWELMWISGTKRLRRSFGQETALGREEGLWKAQGKERTGQSRLLHVIRGAIDFTRQQVNVNDHRVRRRRR